MSCISFSSLTNSRIGLLQMRSGALEILHLMPCDTRPSPGRRGSGWEERFRDSIGPFPLSFLDFLVPLADRSGRFWLRLPEATTETCRRRFIATWADYVEAVAREAEHRAESHILDIETYLPVRRNTIGVPPTFALWELYLDIPDDVREHPILCEMADLGAELIAIDNVRQP